MKLNSDNNALAENKVLILYLLEQINGDIKQDDLYKIEIGRASCRERV